MEIDEQVLLNEVNKIRLNKEENQAAKSVRNTPPVQPPANTIPEYPDFPGYQPYTPEEANTLPPENIPPPLPEDYIPEEEAGPPPTPPYEVPTAPNIQVQPNVLLLRLMSWLFCAISYDMANVSSMTT